jgi:hypothetical protein
MKTPNLVSSVLVPALIAASYAWAGEPVSLDGQAKAAALLSAQSASDSSVAAIAARSPASVSPPADGLAAAAALLSRTQTYGARSANEQEVRSSFERLVDGHRRAAALLSRPRSI